MNTEQKLEHFLNISVQTASRQNADSFDKYKNSLDAAFDDHREQITHFSNETVKTKKNVIMQSIRKEYSTKESDAKRSLINLRNSIKSQLFGEVEKLLLDFRKKDEYIDFLEKKIKYINSIADNAPVDIYVDSNDSHLKDTLEKKTGMTIHVYDRDFSGGIRGIIPSKNILIDETLKTKINDIYENYRIKY